MDKDGGPVKYPTHPLSRVLDNIHLDCTGEPALDPGHCQGKTRSLQRDFGDYLARYSERVFRLMEGVADGKVEIFHIDLDCLMHVA